MDTFAFNTLASMVVNQQAAYGAEWALHDKIMWSGWNVLDTLVGEGFLAENGVQFGKYPRRYLFTPKTVEIAPGLILLAAL